jgi:heme-degrading monooxygenase HmoA
MIIERAELPVTEGKEPEFEAAMVRGKTLLGNAAGCRSVQLLRGIERPYRYLLLVEWDSVNEHIAFTSTPEFAAFRALAGPFFSAAPSMEHFAAP